MARLGMLFRWGDVLEAAAPTMTASKSGQDMWLAADLMLPIAVVAEEDKDNFEAPTEVTEWSDDE